MVRTKEELLTMIKERVGEGVSDDDLSFVEDMTDSINAMSSSADEITRLKAENERIDKEWRQKFKERFFNTGSEVEETKEYVEDRAPKRYEDLFEIKE